MVNPHDVSTGTAHMGQNSSQVDTSVNNEQGNDDTIDGAESKHERHKEKKGKKRKRSSLANALQEEEGSYAVLASNEDLTYGSTKFSDEDDMAASLQLQTESSPSRPGASYRVESSTSRNSIEVNGDAPVPEERKKRRRRSILESPTPEHVNSKSTNVTSQSIPSIQSLDDVNTEDEAIASYLRGYENDQTITPFSPYSEDVESMSEMENLAAKVARDGSPVLMQSTYQLPSHNGEIPDKKNEEGQMQRREFGADLDDEETNTYDDLLNGTGQHTFDIEAIDDYLNSMLNSANGYDQALSYGIPIDPELAAVGDSDVMPGTEPSLAEREFDFTETPASNKKLSRVYSSRKSRARKVKPKTDVYALPRDGSPSLDYEEQDRPTPGADDLRSHISDTGSVLGDTNRHSSPRSSWELVMKSEKTPPPLTKRSKPRGNKTQQGGRKAKNHDPPLTQIAQKGGMFTQLEMTKLDALRDAYCEEQGINQWKFNDLIHAPVRGNPDVVELWDSIHALFPYRTRMSVSRFCRRRFHNFSARGVWTQSEDEMLGRAVAEKGNSWKAVGALINRFPEDCRDRYRNYHVNAAHRNREHWTEAEVKNLCWAVYDCMLAKREEARRAKQEEYSGRDMPESEPEDSDQEIAEMKLINWQAVSDRMGTSGGARSRLQCSFKWGKLKNAERDQYMREIRAVMKGQKQSERRKGGKAKAKWRHQRAIRNLKNMKLGDRHDFLQALINCDVEKEENIHWRLLGDEQFRGKWTTRDKKAAWEMFKKEVPDSDTMHYRDLAQHLLAELVAENGDKLHERWDPDVDGDITVELRKQRKKKREGKRVRGIQEESAHDLARYKSRRIVESDVEEQAAEEHRDQQSHEEEAETPGSAENHEEEEDPAESRSPDELSVVRDAEQTEAGKQQSSAEDHRSDDSLFQSNSDDGNDDGDDEGLFLSD